MRNKCLISSTRAVGNMVLVEAGLLAGGSGARSYLQRYLNGAWADSSKAAMVKAARDVGNNCPGGVNVSGIKWLLQFSVCTQKQLQGAVIPLGLEVLVQHAVSVPRKRG